MAADTLLLVVDSQGGDDYETSTRSSHEDTLRAGSAPLSAQLPWGRTASRRASCTSINEVESVHGIPGPAEVEKRGTSSTVT